MHVLRCEKCGWFTSNSKKKPIPPEKCARCGEPGTAEEVDKNNAGIACMVMTISDQIDKAVQEHAETHGLMLYQLSARRYVVLRTNFVCTVPFGDKIKRSYKELAAAHGPCSRQEAMKYLYNNSPNLPEYLLD